MRRSTIRCRAALACRLPPRESRCRVRCPDEAGIGATPARAAKLARVPSRSGLSPAATRSVAAVTGPTPLRDSSVGLTCRTSSSSWCSIRSISACIVRCRTANRRSVWRATTSGSGDAIAPGLVLASVVTSRCPLRARNACRTSSGAVISSAWIWFITCALAFAAERRSASRIRIDSTAPSPVFGIAVSVPASTATAAWCASSGSDLPRRRRACRSCRATSTTVSPAAFSARERPAP